MCLIRVRKIEEEVHIPSRRAATTTTTTVITPIPPAPLPPPPPSPPVSQTYSTALVPVSALPPQSNYAYDAGSNSLIESHYGGNVASGYSYQGRPLSNYSVHTINGSGQGATTTTVIKGTYVAEGGVSRSNSRTHRTHSRRNSAVNVINSSRDEIVIGPDGEPYRRVHRHRHRHRSGSREREKSVTRYAHDPDVFRGSRRSVVSVSNGAARGSRRGSIDYYSDAGDPRSSVRYIEARGSMRRIEGAPEVKERDTERYSYGGGGHRRTGSVTYVNPRSSQGSVVHGGGHRRSASAGGRISREKVILVDRE